jgi:acyl-coenzyme A thioesterase PaaI-like protein
VTAEENKAAAIRVAAEFGFDPVPGEDGWFVWGPRANGHFNTLYDPIQVRPLGDGRAIVRFMPQKVLTSANGTMHGGGLLGFIDIALFAGARGCGILGSGWAVTLDLSTQFLGPARHGIAIDAEVELLRETGRLLFLRGLVTQEGESVASFSATVRKSSARA